jgi:hypothetical protein
MKQQDGRYKPKTKVDPVALLRATRKVGGQAEMSRLICVDKNTFTKWKKTWEIPTNFLMRIEQISGIKIGIDQKEHEL